MTTVNIDKRYHDMAKSLISGILPSIKAVVEYSIFQMKERNLVNGGNKDE